MRDVLRRSWWMLAVAALQSLCGCSSAHVGPNQGSSETHFLTRCTDRCGGGLTCICGVCSRACTGDSACTSLADGATCATLESDTCGGSAEQRACELACERDADCGVLGSQHRCEAGVCRAQAASAAASGDRDGRLPAEGPACVASEVAAEIAVTDVDLVDLLFVIDNSPSMAEEQVSLREQFPKLIGVLTTGTRADGSTFPPARDLHLGVVSSNMGAARVEGLEDCAGLGDDGIMLNTPSPEVSGCAPSYPRFLSYLADRNDPEQTAVDFACIATLGTDGCSFEQPLEAGLKALWPSLDIDPQTGEPHQPNRVQFLTDSSGFGEFGHGDTENAGFLRNDPAAGLSAIAIVVVTDQEDCSSAMTDHFAPAGDPLNLRCFYNAQNLYVLDRYINGFKALRPGNENLVVFAAIAGVPADLVEAEDYGAADWSNDAQRAAFYDRILGDTRMLEAVDPNPPDGEANLVPSCVSDRGRAYPPRRIVEVARGFGQNGSVHSICQEDLGPAIDGIIDRIARQLGAVCLPRPLVRDSAGLVEDCELLWELPPAGAAGASTPTSCGQPGFDFLLERERGERVGDRGGAICRVPQLAVKFEPGASVVPTEAGGALVTEGWYYDDFSEDVERSCVGASRQRVAFTSAAKPPSGVVVKLECLSESHPVSTDRSDIAVNLEQPAIGDACDAVVRNGQALAGDAACAVRLSNGELDTSMFCHPQSSVCELECERDADCPPEWICDASAQAVAASGGRTACVAPSCSAGPASATSERVGEACLPDLVPAGGFSDSEVHLGTADDECGGGVCMVFHLRGDPRQDCVPVPPDPATGAQGTVCAAGDEVDSRIYCTCRCDAPDGYAECGCPDGFTCVETLGQGGDDIRGGYCARNGTFTR